jgi:tRNA A37 methylthiotransferase MiaB
VASKIKSVVADAEKTKRFKMINGLKQNWTSQYLNQFIGRKVNVLFEKSKLKNIQSGHSEYFFNVFVKTKKILTNKLLEIKITSQINNRLLGEII